MQATITVPFQSAPVTVRVTRDRGIFIGLDPQHHNQHDVFAYLSAALADTEFAQHMTMTCWVIHISFEYLPKDLDTLTAATLAVVRAVHPLTAPQARA